MNGRLHNATGGQPIKLPLKPGEAIIFDFITNHVYVGSPLKP